MTLNSFASPALERVLRDKLRADNPEALSSWLVTLSHGEAHKVGCLLGEKLLPQVDEDLFWRHFRYLSLWEPKAYLGTCLKAAVKRHSLGCLDLSHPVFLDYAHEVVHRGAVIDKAKTLSALLPLLQKPEEITLLLDAFQVRVAGERASLLLRCESLAACYCLFETLRCAEDDTPLLERCCRELARRGGRYSFNLASLVRSYFDLSSVGGTFSLQLEPYQLHRASLSYERFRQVMQSI